MNALAGARILITGASGDLGRAMAEHLGDAGARLALQCRTGRAALQPLLERAAAHGREAVVVEADLTDPAAPDRIAAELGERWGGLDLLVNNAGGARREPLGELAPDTWESSLRLNLTAPFRLLQALAGLLADADGSVVNVTSVAALTGGAFGPHYAAAKAGLIGLTRSAARELGPRGIRVNAIAPGAVESAMTSSVDPGVLAGITGATALGRLVRPVEIAEAVAYLATATAVTGQTLVVDAGRHFL
ncbi:SDR family oxidoreductase [Streptomyces sp. TR1341]|uniref:SDR family oxidoreductase n=1 Tax=Streptomyces sp. TR1341 TaxID=2601266 RepID=UPI00138AE31F|nr:SDR family oxidoreductase [Streptomyces sp. TR1341]